MKSPYTGRAGEQLFNEMAHLQQERDAGQQRTGGASVRDQNPRLARQRMEARMPADQQARSASPTPADPKGRPAK